MGGIWLGIYIGLLIIGIYNFLQYMCFFQQNEEFKPSKGRWCFEAGSYIFCVVFTLLVGLFSKLFEVHASLSLVILALKILLSACGVYKKIWDSQVGEQNNDEKPIKISNKKKEEREIIRQIAISEEEITYP